jgi:hypothetical protein
MGADAGDTSVTHCSALTLDIVVQKLKNILD